MPLFPSPAALALQALTATAGYALVNGTGTIISWTAPNDGALHWWMVIGAMRVGSTETGGQITMSFTTPDGASGNNPQVWPGGQSGGFNFNQAYVNGVAKAGTTVSLVQNTALTGGAATLWAGIWAA